MNPIPIVRRSTFLHCKGTLDRLGFNAERVLAGAGIPNWHHGDAAHLQRGHDERHGAPPEGRRREGRTLQAEQKWFGDDIDITKFPAPLAHGGDGGRYLQTAGLNIVRTPDGKWTNWSTARAMIANPPADSRNTLTGSWLPWQHNGMTMHMSSVEDAQSFGGKHTRALALGMSVSGHKATLCEPINNVIFRGLSGRS